MDEPRTALVMLSKEGCILRCMGNAELLAQLRCQPGRQVSDCTGIPFPLGGGHQRLSQHALGAAVLEVAAVEDGEGHVWQLREAPPETRLAEALRVVAADTPGISGDAFYRTLVKTLADTLQVKYAFIGLLEEPALSRVNTLVVCANGEIVDNIRYGLQATPCATVIDQSACLYETGVCQSFPDDHLLVAMGVDSYIGLPLMDNQRRPFGLLVALHDQPLTGRKDLLPLFYAFAARVAAELLRDRAARDQAALAETLRSTVAARTAELEQLNRELEAFSYTVSHDLRAPLRHIISFGDVLKESLQTGELTDAQDSADRMIQAAQRLRAMIDALLELSRVNRVALHKQSVNLNTLCEQVRQELAAPAGVLWQMDPLPTLDADPALLRVVVQNLLENAVKYSSKRATPHIHVGAVQRDEQIGFFVRDNGAGFDMALAEKLFQPFQRLHSPRDFAGEGIGLASVARIVHRHGGQISADARPDEGACFTVTLPG